MPEIKKSYKESDSIKSVVLEINEDNLGLNQFTLLNDAVKEEISGGIKSVHLDLSGLNTINSSGLGILISCLKSAKNSNAELKLLNCNEKILSILKLTKLDKVFDL
ncbi:MAG: hypothetical protein HGGPFJEG_02554 [Ignavibacteria bacterium]|nr:hypothetical protein [Ignavibacteria bacterium]